MKYYRCIRKAYPQDITIQRPSVENPYPGTVDRLVCECAGICGINPDPFTVTEINLKKNPNSTLQELYSIIGCDLVELVQIDRDMVLICDEEGKCKNVQGAFTFIGWGTVIAGTAIILGGSGDRFKALPENLASFQMITEWVEPADVPPLQASVIAF